MGGRGQCRPPKLKLAPQNYFPGAGAADLHESYNSDTVIAYTLKLPANNCGLVSLLNYSSCHTISG